MRNVECLYCDRARPICANPQNCDFIKKHRSLNLREKSSGNMNPKKI